MGTPTPLAFRGWREGAQDLQLLCLSIDKGVMRQNSDTRRCADPRARPAPKAHCERARAPRRRSAPPGVPVCRVRSPDCTPGAGSAYAQIQPRAPMRRASPSRTREQKRCEARQRSPRWRQERSPRRLGAPGRGSGPQAPGIANMDTVLSAKGSLMVVCRVRVVLGAEIAWRRESACGMLAAPPCCSIVLDACV